MMRTDTYDPELWQLVPKEPTQEMLDKGVAAAVNQKNAGPWCPHLWTAMLANAPTPPASAPSVDPVGVAKITSIGGLRTSCTFQSSAVPHGTALYTTPPSAEGARDAVLAEVMVMIVNKFGLRNTMVASVFDAIGEMQSNKEA